jgi:hypothetical protein
MKNIFFVLSGLAGAAAGFLIMNGTRRQPVEELAHRLEAAWADHHTVA